MIKKKNIVQELSKELKVRIPLIIMETVVYVQKLPLTFNFQESLYLDMIKAIFCQTFVSKLFY